MTSPSEKEVITEEERSKPVGPLPITVQCGCQEWMVDEAWIEDLRKGFRFICPSCAGDIKLVKHG
jgi:hypothetical protein